MSLNVYQIVTERILEQLEKGVIPWRKTWCGNQPINYITRKPYRGINTCLLPYGGEYLTFKQAKDLGGSVRKGEKSHIIVFYKMLDNLNSETGENKKIPYLKYSNVFHISQCEGIESKLPPFKTNETAELISEAQNIIDAYKERSEVKIEHIEGSDRACYIPSTDTISLPAQGQFMSINEYYGTFFHELAHSTGHKSRLNRLTEKAHFGNEIYSREELTAEISAAMLMNVAEIEQPDTFTNSVAYIQSPRKALKEDTKAIITASSQAQKATDFILGKENENV